MFVIQRIIGYLIYILAYQLLTLQQLSVRRSQNFPIAYLIIFIYFCIFVFIHASGKPVADISKKCR